jgi:hypothetical protein
MLLADLGYDADWIGELGTKKGAWTNLTQMLAHRFNVRQPPYLYRLQQSRTVFNRI